MLSLFNSLPEEDVIIYQTRKLQVLNFELDTKTQPTIKTDTRILLHQSLDLYKEATRLNLFNKDERMEGLGRNLLIELYRLFKTIEREENPFPYCPDFSDILQNMGQIPTPRLLSRLGRHIAKEYRETFQQEPPMFRRYVDGAYCLVKFYPIKYESWLKEKISSFLV